MFRIIQESLGMKIFNVVCLKDPYLDLCLFILYMNDICYTSGLLKTVLFADDTTCFYSHKDVQTLCNIVNNELKEVCNWFKPHKLSLNAKIKIIIIIIIIIIFLGIRFQTNNINENYEIYLDGCKLARVEEANFLGIKIDESLIWKNKKQIDNVCKRCARIIGVQNDVKRFLAE